MGERRWNGLMDSACNQIWIEWQKEKDASCWLQRRKRGQVDVKFPEVRRERVDGSLTKVLSTVVGRIEFL